VCGLAAGCGSLVIASTATALSCAPPEFSHGEGPYTAGDVVVIEGRGWTGGSDEECESSPFGDVRISMASSQSGQVLVARGAADDDGRFVVAVRVPAPVSGRVEVEVVAMTAAGDEIPGITSSSPFTVESGSSDATGVEPVSFGPVDDGPAVWPWFVLAIAASGLGGAALSWRLADRRRVRTRELVRT
jgi:hypothetical protein